MQEGPKDRGENGCMLRINFSRRGREEMSELHEKVLERVKFDLSALAEPMGYHSLDIKELHSTECPALFEYAKRIAEIENARLLPIITQLLKMNEKLVSALRNIDLESIQHISFEEWATRNPKDLAAIICGDMKLARKTLDSNQAQMEKLAGEDG
jgi:hypothetical protein